MNADRILQCASCSDELWIDDDATEAQESDALAAEGWTKHPEPDSAFSYLCAACSRDAAMGALLCDECRSRGPHCPEHGRFR